MPIPIRSATVGSRHSTLVSTNSSGALPDVPKHNETKSAEFADKIEHATTATKHASRMKPASQHDPTTALRLANFRVPEEGHARPHTTSSSTSVHSSHGGGTGTKHVRSTSQSKPGPATSKFYNNSQNPQSRIGSESTTSTLDSSKLRPISLRANQSSTAAPKTSSDGTRKPQVESSVWTELVQLQLLSRTAQKSLASFEQSAFRETAANEVRVDETFMQVQRAAAHNRYTKNATMLKALAHSIGTRGDTIENFWQCLSIALDKIGGYVQQLNTADGCFGEIHRLLHYITTRFNTGASSLLVEQKNIQELDCPINNHVRAMVLDRQRDIALHLDTLMAVPETNVDLGLATVVQRHILAAQNVLTLLDVFMKIDEILEADGIFRRSSEVDLALKEVREARSERVSRSVVWNG